MRCALFCLVLPCLAACGAGSRPDDDDDSGPGGDGDVDSDGDGDGDPRPECPAGDDLVLGSPCDGQEDCDPPLCARQGGVCVEETWTCGRCDYCFFRRTPHPEDPTLACDPDQGACVPP
ncbi:MAG: hypothetical protein HYY06_25390 [Deltaproteobacteria bacterium]|nr:hypothetical protein [Deltaproteobacteria bacterium]